MFVSFYQIEQTKLGSLSRLFEKVSSEYDSYNTSNIIGQSSIVDFYSRDKSVLLKQGSAIDCGNPSLALFRT